MRHYSLVVVHQNVPMTSVLIDFTLDSWKNFDIGFFSEWLKRNDMDDLLRYFYLFYKTQSFDQLMHTYLLSFRFKVLIAYRFSIMELDQSGLLAHFQEKWIPRDTCAHTRETTVEASGIKLSDLQMLFIFLFVGLFTATCIFVAEWTVCRLLKCLKNKSVTIKWKFTDIFVLVNF